MKRLLPAAVLVLAVAACPASEEEEGTTGSRVLAAKVCSRQSECCPKNESASDCEATFEMVLNPLFMTEGISIDSAKFAACIDKMSAASCEEVGAFGGTLPALTYCGEFWSGTRGLGEACGGADLLASLYGDDQCESGQCVDEKCVAEAKQGEACGEVECEAGLACDLGTYRCVAPLASGAECEGDWNCAQTEACIASGSLRTCQPLTVIQVGEACGSGTLCVLGESMCFCPVGGEGCVSGVCGNSSRCQQ